MTSISDTMPCSPQKSSISWVSRRPPIAEPASLPTSKQQVECGNRCGLGGRADQGHRAIPLQQLEVRVQVVICGDRVEDEVEAADVLRHLGLVSGDDDFIRAKAKSVGGLARRRGEEHGACAERMGKLHAHVAQPTQTDDADFLPFADLPMAQRGIGGDACTEQRSGASRVQAVRHAQDVRLVDHDAAPNSRRR